MFENKFGASPNREEWTGKDGIIPSLRKLCDIPDGTKIEYILNDYLECKRKGRAYSGEGGSSPGRCPIIESDSAEAQIIADVIEDGMSIGMAQRLVNRHRRECDGDLEPYSYSAVRGLSKRLSPVIEKITLTKQGSADVNSPWATARHNWVRLLLIRFGLLDCVQLEAGSIPDYFNKGMMPKLFVEQIAWWDEMHKECVIGGIGEKRPYRIRFKRDVNGKLDPDGEALGEARTVMAVKFDEEMDFS